MTHRHGTYGVYPEKSFPARLFFPSGLILLAVFFLWDYKIAYTVVLAVLSLTCLAVAGVRIVAALLALRGASDIIVTPEAIAALAPDDCPVYTILAPLYHEANIATSLPAALARLDYPPDKLDVKFLLEEDDRETRDVLAACELPSTWEVLIVPDGFPKTKPRACNAGLAVARGVYLVIYDAEDRPEPDQLKKAVAAFQRQPPEVVCLQAKLNYYNARQTWLTRFFTLEYTAWFDLFLPGLYRLGFPIPLGGTSNHFRTDALRALGGWDAYNVTEDCELGIRLARNPPALSLTKKTSFAKIRLETITNDVCGNFSRAL